MIATEKVLEYLNRLASADPTPGGGAVGALHVAQGAALISMVANFTTGARFAQVEHQAKALAVRAQQIMAAALQAADEDETYFKDLIATYQLPKQTQAQKTDRSAHIQAATKAATRPLVKTVDLSEVILKSAHELRLIGNQNVISDVAAAAESVKAAVSIALVTLEMNLEAIDDECFKSQLRAKVKQAEQLIVMANGITQQVRYQVNAAAHEGLQNKVLRGKPVAERLRASLREHIQTLAQHEVIPKLAVILATDNEATVWYVKSIQKAAQAQGMCCDVHVLQQASEADLMALIHTLNHDAAVHGIILQTPLPEHINMSHLINLIDVEKDIDGANPVSLGRLSAGQKSFAPATARAVMEILAYYEIPLQGEEVVIIGRSNVVGKPLAQLLLQHDATVTLCHSRTQDLSKHTQAAKIIAVAAGKIGLLTEHDVTPESIVIDVGTNINQDGDLVGDVTPNVAAVARALSPVPGGVGTVTTTLLLLHTVQAALDQVLMQATANT